MTVSGDSAGDVSGGSGADVGNGVVFWPVVFFFTGWTLILPSLHGKHLNAFCFVIWCVVWIPGCVAIWRGMRLWSKVSLGSRAVVTGGVLLLVLGLVGGILELIAIHRSVDPHVHARELNDCRDRLTTIGWAIEAWREGHRGRFPERLEELTTDPKAATALVWNAGRYGTTTQPFGGEEAARMGIGAKSHYAYLGAGLGASIADNVVVVYEPAGRHWGTYSHVLLADGRAAMLEPAEAAAVERDIRSGERPVYFRLMGSTKPATAR